MVQRIAFEGALPERRPARAVFASLAVAGLIALPGCRAQSAADVPSMVPVREFLRQPPMGLAQESNEPTQHPLNGKVAACMGRESCRVEIYPGDVFLNVKFDPVNDGNMEITIARTGGNEVGLESRVDFNSGEQGYDYQTIAVGRDSVLFNTDLTVRAERSDGWRYYLVVR